MKKLLCFALLCFALPVAACHAQGKKTDTLPFSGDDEEGTKRCEAISTADKKYYYGEAELMSFARAVSTPESSPKREKLLPMIASFYSPTQGKKLTYIKGEWKDPSVPEHKLEPAPLPISLETGKNYGFCYQQRGIPGSKKIHTFIDYPETIQLSAKQDVEELDKRFGKNDLTKGEKPMVRSDYGCRKPDSLEQKEQYNSMDVIFTGIVTDISSDCFITFEVTKMWKGADTKQITVRDPKRCNFVDGEKYAMSSKYVIYTKYEGKARTLVVKEVCRGMNTPG